MSEKKPIVRINLSTPFLVKNRCKGCGGHPDVYYYLRNKMLHLDPRKIVEDFDRMKRLYNRMCGDFYLKFAPRYFKDLSLFSHKPTYKSFSPRLHMSRGKKVSHNITEFLICKCGDTFWAFNQVSSWGSPEITNRRSKYTYPTKIGF